MLSSISNCHSGCIFPYQSNVVASRSTAHPAGTFLLCYQLWYVDRCSCSEWQSLLFDGHLRSGYKEACWGGHTAPLCKNKEIKVSYITCWICGLYCNITNWFVDPCFKDLKTYFLAINTLVFWNQMPWNQGHCTLWWSQLVSHLIT